MQRFADRECREMMVVMLFDERDERSRGRRCPLTVEEDLALASECRGFREAPSQKLEQRGLRVADSISITTRPCVMG